MATYFHGNSSEIQTPSDGLQTLIFMNPSGYVPYSDTPPPPPTSQPTNNSLFFYDSSSNSLSHPLPLPLPSHSSQHLVGIPLSAATGLSTPDSNSQFLHHPHHHLHNDISALHGFVPRVHYNLWNQVDTAAREAPRSQQGLSLSLSSQQPGFGSIRGDREIPSGQSRAMAAVVSGEDMRISGGSPSSISGISVVTNGVSGIQGVLLSSKYLKAAQELLEEVVKVGNGIISEFSKKGSGSKTVGELSQTAVTGCNGSVAGDEGNEKVTELSTAERQEVQMKKAKLMNMLDEVEQRYRQYHQQMQIVISSFEQAAGLGSARTYTSLALQTISKQFRCLKDAITGQIRVANKSLGEEDCNGGKIEGSRLKYVDHQLRQQRALQQLGMMQQNAWRPQRGLPERSVSVLRAWLFEHFLHPYPKDSDKKMLAKQTGLTRSQVSNWFINARVRLWKPMVEEMYMEEIKEQEQNGTGEKMRNGDDYASKSTGPSRVKSPTTENQTTSAFSSIQENSTNHQHLPSKTSFSTPSPNGENTRTQSGFSLIGSSDFLEGITQGSPKKPRISEIMQSPGSFINMDVKPSSEVNNGQITPVKFNNIERQERDEYSFMGIPNNFIGGFGQYPIGEIGRFDTEQFTQRFSAGNSVSLTLGLPHCENLSLSGAHQNFLPNQNIQLGRRVDIGEPNHHDFGGINNSTPHSSAGFESMNIQNRKGFATQLLPDFVT